MAEQEPYEEEEIAEVERDLERLEDAPSTETEQIDADEEEIREVEREADGEAHVREVESEGDTSAGSRIRAVRVAGGSVGGIVVGDHAEIFQSLAGEDEIQGVEEDLA